MTDGGGIAKFSLRRAAPVRRRNCKTYRDPDLAIAISLFNTMYYEK